MDTFSWMVIERDDKKAYLVLYNKKGLRKVLNTRPLFYEHELEDIMTRRQETKDRTGTIMAGIMQKLMNDPDALERLKKSHEDRINRGKS